MKVTVFHKAKKNKAMAPFREPATAGYYEIFKTPIGLCGIAWSATAILNVQLPARDEKSLRKRLEEFGEPADSNNLAFVATTVSKIQLHLSGTPQTFADVPLEFSRVPQFHQKVYRALQKIPAGTITTYGDLAGLAGSPLASRAVGQAMAKNPFPVIIACHRVLSAAGKLGGFSSFGGVQTKIQLLEIESDGQAGKSERYERIKAGRR
jgi:methylated-DNA-[protein]-cysteine S-methyltransferase